MMKNEKSKFLWVLCGLISLGTNLIAEERVAVEGEVSTLSVDGVEVAVSQEPITEPWRVVLYFDQQLSSSRHLHQAAEAFLEELDASSDNLEVQVLVAAPEARESGPPTNDAAEWERELTLLSLRSQGADEIRRLRNQVVNLAPPDNALVLEGLNRESALRQARRDTFLSWLGRQGPARGPRAIFLLDDSLGVDPMDFWRRNYSGSEMLGITSEMAWAEATAALGWTLFPVALEPTDKKRTSTDGGIFLPGRQVVEPRDEKPLLSDQELSFLPLRGRMQTLASFSGGVPITRVEEIALAFHSLWERQWLKFPFSGKGGEKLNVEWRGREGRVPTLLPGGIPEALSLLRLEEFSRGAQEGAIEIAGEFSLLSATEARVEAEFAEPVNGRWKVTTASHLESGEYRLSSQEVNSPGKSWTGEMGVVSQSDAVLVLVEDLESSRWGAVFANYATSDFTRTGSIQEEFPEEERRLTFLPLDGPAVGRRWVEVESGQAVATVRFLLDGIVVEETQKHPFKAKISFSREKRQHSLEAVALDAKGREINRRLLIVNRPKDAFAVRITSPQPGRYAGPVSVNAEVVVPKDSQLERVDYYWLDRLVSTSRKAPHERRVLIPLQAPAGFVRVVAKLNDGRQTEDLILVNGARFGEKVAVELVELYVVVTDRDGRPVEGLPQVEFTVTEGEKAQSLETFREAGELPLTIGLALDSSSSLFKRMPAVKAAAHGFMNNLVSGRDRAFLVGFDTKVELKQGTTRELRRIGEELDSLQPHGQTAIWSGVVYSLLQLDGISGRKALVVFYDGDDEDGKDAWRTTLELTKKAGIPVYLIVMNNEAARSGGASLKSRAFVNRLEEVAEAGGGKVYYVRTDGDLDPVFQQIADELRAHYLLTYYPEDANIRKWREVKVNLKKRGLTARTVAGVGG